jgi:hypothetical protein
MAYVFSIGVGHVFWRATILVLAMVIVLSIAAVASALTRRSNLQVALLGAVAAGLVSNAQSIRSLCGKFAYVGATVGDALVAGGSIAAGVDPQYRPVGVAEVGIGLGAYAPVPGAGGVGASNAYTQTWLGR